MEKRLLYILLLLVSFTSVTAQQLITFPAQDELVVSADFYETEDESNKYLLLFHQAEYSRGEFSQIAIR